MFDAWKKIEYTGKVDDIVRIPCRMNGNLTDRNDKLIISTCGKGGWKKDRNGYVPANYFGLHPTKDKSESSYTSGYTATHSGGNRYSISEDKQYFQEYFALKIFVGAPEEVAANPKSNVNKWLRAISFTKRDLWFWVLSIVLCLGLVGIPMLCGCVYRLYQSFVAKSCMRKAKKSFKEKGKIVVF